MLINLNIRNFALIDELDIDFGPGLNIITGETGAGKSIIVDALMLALGDRASFSMIREGAQKAVIEATFMNSFNSEIYSFLKNSELDFEEDTLILRRELTSRGLSRCFVNDSPVQLSLLKQIGDQLVDFHGQHEHQTLLRKEYHISILDKLAGFYDLKTDYLQKYTLLKQVIGEYSSLLDNEKKNHEKSESAIFELNQIKKISPNEGESEKLEEELTILQNSEFLLNLTDELSNLLSESDRAALPSVNAAKKILEQLQNIDRKFNPYFEECSSAEISISEIASFTRNYHSNIEFDNVRIQEIRERISELNGLKKKYGSVEMAIERMNRLEKDLSGIFDFESSKKILSQEILVQKSEIAKIVKELSLNRKAIAKKSAKSIINNLKDLGIENADFYISINHDISDSSDLTDFSINLDEQYYRLNPDGIDVVEFFISTNKGEVPKPLIDVASGGEISRIMLSIKNILAGKDEVPVMIFDEIDTGISGRIAQKVGIAMKELSKKHQLISITHLAQIAALGDKNISVKKFETNGRTSVSADVIEGDIRIHEIAKLISGEIITDSAVKSVIELSKVEKKL